MKLAMISYRLPSQRTRRGGIERVAHDIAQGLSLRGHEVVVWSYEEAADDAAYAVRALPGRALFETWLGCRLTMGFLGNLINCLPNFRDFDALLTHGDSLLLPLKHPRVIRVMHGSALGEALSSESWARALMQMGVYFQELVTAVGPGACVAVSRNTVRYNPVLSRVIPNGVDLSLFTPAPEGKRGPPSILFVGTMDGRKRGRTLIRWFLEHVKSHIPDAVLHCVSPEGPCHPGVIYYPDVDQTELAALYRDAWLLASASRYEGFGLPYLEAMASGTPVIATPNPGSREILGDGRFGVLAHDDEFGPMMRALLGDVDRRRSYAALGRERAKEFDLQKSLDGYETLLHSLMKA